MKTMTVRELRHELYKIEDQDRLVAIADQDTGLSWDLDVTGIEKFLDLDNNSGLVYLRVDAHLDNDDDND